MRTFIFLLCTFTFGFTPIHVLSQKATINIDADKTLAVDEVFKLIKAQTNYRFIYQSDMFSGYPQVAVKKGSIKANSLLEQTLSGGNFSFELSEKNTIIIKDKGIDTAYQRTISGTVRDENGVPLSLVNVLFYNGDTFEEGTITDFDGNYSLTTSKVLTTIKISYIGFEVKSIDINNSEVIDVGLVESTESLDQVVVTGFKEIKRERVTGATTQISSKEIANLGFSQIDEVLEASVAGLNFVKSGRPGQDASITIRGANSILGSNEPQWIVDGLPLQGDLPNIGGGGEDAIQNTLLTTGIGNLSPDDIESITVLKDAAATAIYGAKAANGVIVIKTKSGREGKPRINASISTTLNERPQSNVELMNTEEKIRYENLLFRQNPFQSSERGRAYRAIRDQEYGYITPENAQSQLNELASIETDWMKEIYSPSFSNQYNFSISGGSQFLQYYGSVSVLNEDGTDPVSNFKRSTANARATFTPNSKLKIDAIIRATTRNSVNTASAVDPFEYALYANPYEKPYNSDGSYRADLSYNASRSANRENSLAWGSFNALHDFKNNTSKDTYLDVSAQFKLNWEFLKNLTFENNMIINLNANDGQVQEGEDTYTNFTNNWFNPYTPGGEVPLNLVNGSLGESSRSSKGFTMRNTFTYANTFNQDHIVEVFAGQEIGYRNTNNSSSFYPIYNEEYGIGGFPEFLTDYQVLPNSIDFSRLVSTGELESKDVSFFANATYSYKDKYILSGSYRADGTNVIGNQNNYQPLWNTSLRYNLHRENFLRNSSAVNLLSLRVGYGFTANITRAVFPFETLSYSELFTYDDGVLPTSFSYANPVVKWQTTEDRNLGLDMRFFNALDIVVNYYNNRSFDLLNQDDLPNSTGISALTVNGSSIVNTGWEFAVSSRNIKTENFEWRTNVNFSISNNEVTDAKFDNLQQLDPRNGTDEVIGYPVDAIFGFEFAGVDPETGQVLAFQRDGTTFDVDKYTNQSADISDPVFKYLGQQSAPYYGGVGTTFRYKQFTFNINAEYKFGNYFTLLDLNRNATPQNVNPRELNIWLQPGDITDVPFVNRGSDDRAAFKLYNFDTNLDKGDYLRINQASFRYSFNSILMKKIGAQNGAITLTGRNLLTLTKFRGVDPSLGGRIGYPNTRNYTVTVNLSF